MTPQARWDEFPVGVGPAGSVTRLYGRLTVHSARVESRSILHYSEGMNERNFADC